MIPIVYHIPVCPFSQRLEILLALKGKLNSVEFKVVDITQPRPDWMLELSGGSTALPIMDIGNGCVLKESLVVLQYLEDITSDAPIAQQDPQRRAVENMMVTMEGAFANAGYGLVMNQDLSKREAMHERLLLVYKQLNAFLERYSETDDYLFSDFGWAEVVFTPFFMRFWFLDYYENFTLPSDAEYSRVKHWRELCLAHPCAQQVSKEEIVKLYFDYAKGAGNGALLPGRTVSSFTFEPAWSSRPWPPENKYEANPTDKELGLLV